jgi:hypothetical protein
MWFQEQPVLRQAADSNATAGAASVSPSRGNSSTNCAEVSAFQHADLDPGAQSPVLRALPGSGRGSAKLRYFIAFDSTRGSHWYLDLKDWYILI